MKSKVLFYRLCESLLLLAIFKLGEMIRMTLVFIFITFSFHGRVAKLHHSRLMHVEPALSSLLTKSPTVLLSGAFFSREVLKKQ